MTDHYIKTEKYGFEERALYEARMQLIKKLSSTANSSDIEAIVRAIEKFVDFKVRTALDSHESTYNHEYVSNT